MPPAKPLVVGVLALQGDVAEHLRVLEGAGVRTVVVRTPADLDEAAGLIIPGGESTTIWKLAELFELAGPLRTRVASGMPVFGRLLRRNDHARCPAYRPGQRPANARRDRHDHPAERVRPAGGLVRERPVHRWARRRPVPRRVHPRPVGPSGWAGTPRPLPPSRAPARSSRSGRDRRGREHIAAPARHDGSRSHRPPCRGARVRT
jgi:hypothetical protein